MNPADRLAVRQAIQSVLEHRGLGDDVALEMDLAGAVCRALSEAPERQGTLESLAEGMRLDAELRYRWGQLFHTEPNWDTRTNQAFLLWLKERPVSESLGRFAEWWYASDWRGVAGQPPTTAQVRELWPQAFLEHRGAQGEESAFPLPEGV